IKLAHQPVPALGLGRTQVREVFCTLEIQQLPARATRNAARMGRGAFAPVRITCPVIEGAGKVVGEGASSVHAREVENSLTGFIVGGRLATASGTKSKCKLAA